MSSSSRDFFGQKGDDKRDSFNEYDWVAAAKSASFSNGNDANIKAKKGESSSPSSAANSALSEVSCDAFSIMEWATDLLSPRERENNAQEDLFTENPKEKESPLRHRRIPTPSRVRSNRQGNYPDMQRLPENDLLEAQMTGVPNWEGTTITADARKSDDVSVMTPLGVDAQRNYPKTTLTDNKHAASDSSNFDNWDQFEVSKWDSYAGQSSHFSESEEGVNATYKKQSIQPRKKRKLIWVGSIAVFLIVIIAVAVPLSKRSNNSSATRGNENISTGSKNTTTVPVASDSTPSQPAASPESEPAMTEDENLVQDLATTVPVESIPASPESEPDITEDESLVYGQGTTVPVESIPASPESEPVITEDESLVYGQGTTVPVESIPASPESEPAITEDESLVHGQATTVPVESIPAPPQPKPSANEPVSSPVSTVVESNPAPSDLASNNEPPVSTVVETGPSPSQPVAAPDNDTVSPPVSTVVESNPAPSQPAPASITEPVSTVVESNPAPSQPVPASNNEPISSPVSTVVESKPTPSQPAPAANNEPESPPASTVVEPNPAPSQPVPDSNNEPVSTPASAVVVSNPAPSQPAPTPYNEPVASPAASNVVELSIQEKPASSPNNAPVKPSNNQQETGSNSAVLQTPATSQSVTVPNPPPTSKPTQLPTLPPTPSCINVQIKTDKFGHETSWVLRDVDRDTEIASVPEDTYGENEEVSQDLCGLESGRYKFIIRDKYGDGMCCGNGRGKYRVFLNGQRIVVGGYFKKELSYDILVGYDPGTLTEREYQYWEGHNRRRKEFHVKHGTEYVPLAWSHSLADRARAWAKALLDECDDISIRHDPNRNGDGENLAKNFGSASSGFDQIQPVEKIVSRWVEREMEWDWPENAHLTQVSRFELSLLITCAKKSTYSYVFLFLVLFTLNQALWRGSSYVGCADAVEVKSNGHTCHMQVCRYRRAGNCNMGSSGGDWLTEMLKDETTCGEQCPAEGCYVTSFLTE